MNYQSLFKITPDTIVRSVITGAGDFGTSYIVQASKIKGLEVTAVCEQLPEKAVSAYLRAGIPREKISICESASSVSQAFDLGNYIVVEDFDLLVDLPIDVLVEGTGNPRIGAKNAITAINNGIHVAMVSKEVDSIAGTILSDKAQKAGLVYTAVEGDQPSLLIGLVSWANVLGLQIVCAGKSSEYDYIYNPENDSVTWSGKTVTSPHFSDIWSADAHGIENIVKLRSEILADFPRRCVADLCEMGITANATGLKPSSALLHAPIARPQEISEILVPKEDGGILDGPGSIDIVNCLRRPDEASLAGGVFIVVTCQDHDTWTMLAEKGHLVSGSGRYAAIIRPAHLLGIETPVSVFAAALMGHATGAEIISHRYDLVGKSTQHIAKGTTLMALGHHHTIDGVEARLVNYPEVRQQQLVPYYLLDGVKLSRDLTTGKDITTDDIELDSSSELLSLRQEQDETLMD